MQRRVSGFGKGSKIINLERKKSLSSQDNLICLDYTNIAYDPTARNSLVFTKANTTSTKLPFFQNKTLQHSISNFHQSYKTGYKADIHNSRIKLTRKSDGNSSWSYI